MEYSLNQELNGIEVVFPEKPDLEYRLALKSLGFRWSRRKRLWYAKQSDHRLDSVKALEDKFSKQKTEETKLFNADERANTMKFTIEELEEALQDGRTGFCIACGCEAYGVEPDATKYKCEDCGENKVYGAEKILIMGLAG